MIAKEARSVDSGHTLASETVQKIVALRLSHPLASQGLIAELTGHTPETVSRALATPYARSVIDSTKDVVTAYADKLRAMQGNAVEYMDKSINKGHQALDLPAPPPQILTNARECATTVSKITGLLKDQVQVRTRLTVDDDYKDIASLASDPAIVAFLSHDSDTSTQEGEPGTGGPAGVEGDPTSYPAND